MRLLFLPLLCCAPLFAGAEPRPWREILSQIRSNVAQQILRADNYICVQDLSRFYYTPKSEAAACEQPPSTPSTSMSMKDHLRLDVTVSEGNEIYAWHGENKFSSKSLTEIVRHGPVSSGGFTGYLRNIFIAAGVEFIHHEPLSINGQMMNTFDYHVPLKVSRYQIRAGDHLVIVPFHGSFTASSDTLQLHTLTVTADGDAIPDNAELCAIKATVVYKLAHISSVDSLIPASFDMIYGSGRNRSLTESRGEYSACRQYSGESTVHFDLDESPAGAAGVDVQAETLRAGLTLRIALDTEIDSENAYAGMKVEGKLAHPAKIGSGVILPAGTRVDGLITRFETYFSPEPQTLINIEFDHLSAANKSYFFHAIHATDLYQQFVQMPGRRMSSRTVTHPAAVKEDEAGVISFPKSKIHLDRKFVAEYQIVDQK